MNHQQTSTARSRNPRNKAGHDKRQAHYEPGPVCANCCDYTTGRCGRLACSVKRTTRCDYYRPLPRELREGYTDASTQSDASSEVSA